MEKITFSTDGAKTQRIYLVCAVLKMTPINQIAVCNGEKDTAFVEEADLNLIAFSERRRRVCFLVWYAVAGAIPRKWFNQRLL